MTSNCNKPLSVKKLFSLIKTCKVVNRDTMKSDLSILLLSNLSRCARSGDCMNLLLTHSKEFWIFNIMYCCVCVCVCVCVRVGVGGKEAGSQTHHARVWFSNLMQGRVLSKTCNKESFLVSYSRQNVIKGVIQGNNIQR